MKNSEFASNLFGRIIGAITVTGAAFFLLGWWDTWGLSMHNRMIVSAALGVLFLLFGDSVWRWIANIDLWS